MKAFQSYDEYMGNIFDCVNRCLYQYLEGMKGVYSNGQGGYKNVLYPDLEVASDATKEHIQKLSGVIKEKEKVKVKKENKKEKDDDELSSLFSAFGSPEEDDEEEDTPDGKLKTEGAYTFEKYDVFNRIKEIQERARASKVNMPFFVLTDKMGFEPFTIFCFACGILSSTQTDYAGIFQIINENGNLSTPTIESAGKLYYGDNFSITGAYGDMSLCLEQIQPVLDLRVVPSMPFSTPVSPDKRIIDYLFGKNPMKIDENYQRFLKMLTKEGEKLDDILCNKNVLEAMEISYKDGSRLFSYIGDEGSGRKFFIKKFCEKNSLNALSVNCKKLFAYDYAFVEKAIWAVTRECILTEGCLVLEELSYREEEKEKFFGYMDLFFTKLTEKGVTVFCNSKESINFKEITKEQITLLTLDPPDIDGRVACWNYYKKGFKWDSDVDFFEMATKFLFTPGKIKDAIPLRNFPRLIWITKTG